MLLKFIIPGEPVPLKRHGGNGYYTCEPFSKIKESIGWDLKYQLRDYNADAFKMYVPVRLYITFFMVIPAVPSKAKRAITLDKPHPKRPPLSNLIKLYEDAANDILYKDDAQIAETVMKKMYSDTPRTEIILEEITNMELFKRPYDDLVGLL